MMVLTPSLPAPSETGPINLVLAVVVKTDEGGAKAELKITRVYAGDAGLADAMFTDRLGRNLSVKADGFKLGEEGLWSVARSDEKLVVTRDPLLPFPGCARKRLYPRYAELTAVAEAVGSVAATPKERRPRLLTEYALSRTPEVAAWAVIALDAGGEPLDKFAARLDVVTAGQVAVDEALCRRRQEDWTESKARDGLLRSWVAGKADSHDAGLILGRIDLSAQKDELTHERAADLSRAAAENARWPRESRLEAVRRVGLSGARAVNDDPAFDWLLLQVRTNPDVEFRRKAAGTLKRFTLTLSRLEALTELLKERDDREVINLLQRAVQQKEKRE